MCTESASLINTLIFSVVFPQIFIVVIPDILSYHPILHYIKLSEMVLLGPRTPPTNLSKSALWLIRNLSKEEYLMEEVN